MVQTPQGGHRHGDLPDPRVDRVPGSVWLDNSAGPRPGVHTGHVCVPVQLHLHWEVSDRRRRGAQFDDST